MKARNGTSPAPWTVSPGGHVRDANGDLVALVTASDDGSNARLIKAGPEMLRVLEETHRFLICLDDPFGLSLNRALLRKACRALKELVNEIRGRETDGGAE